MNKNQPAFGVMSRSGERVPGHATWLFIVFLIQTRSWGLFLTSLRLSGWLDICIISGIYQGM